MQLSLEGLERALPHYLSASRIQGVKRALAEFPEIKFFYLNAYQNEALQGDCWSQLTVFNFADGTRKKIRGMLLSNSCDLDSSNRSLTTPYVTFCPIISLDRLAETWRQAGFERQQVEGTVAAIKRQEISNYMFLPAGASFETEMIACFEQAFSLPYAVFESEAEKRKLATLTDPSFYLFIFKLSLHFCRMHEDVDRSEEIDGRT